MRIHSDSIEELDVRKAARLAGASFLRLDTKGSRSRAGAFDVILSGSGVHKSQGGYGMVTDEQAATWDEWGIVLGHLYRLDPNLKTPYYADADHFVWMTGGRFTSEFTPAQQHRTHRWHHSGDSVTGSYSVRECKCGAVQRWLHRQTWDEFTGAAA